MLVLCSNSALQTNGLLVSLGTTGSLVCLYCLFLLFVVCVGVFCFLCGYVCVRNAGVSVFMWLGWLFGLIGWNRLVMVALR